MRQLLKLYTTSFDTLDFKPRRPIQCGSIKQSHTHPIIYPCLHRFAGMRFQYSYGILFTSTVKAFGELKTLILGTLPMLLTVTDLNSGKTFIKLSKCLCYYYTCSYMYYFSKFYVYTITVCVTKSILEEKVLHNFVSSMVQFLKYRNKAGMRMRKKDTNVHVHVQNGTLFRVWNLGLYLSSCIRANNLNITTATS